MGSKMNESQFGPFWIYSVCGISNTCLNGSTYRQVFNPVVTKINTCVDRGIRRYSFANGADRKHSSHATVALSLIEDMYAWYSS